MVYSTSALLYVHYSTIIKKSSTADANLYGRGSNAIVVFTTIKSNQDNIDEKSVDEIVMR
jgi:hypothetical protein